MISSAIEQEAWSLLSRHGVSSLPIQMELIASREGIQVIRTASEGDESGFLLRDDQRTLIGLNENNSPRRRRFTVVHELGHWLLRKGKSLIVDHAIRVNKRNDLSSAATDREEIEANNFAAALLMPSSMVNSAVQKEISMGCNDVEQVINRLAALFDVSTEAMRWRLVNLGIIN